MTRSSSVYDRVMASGQLRCAYALYKPGCMKDPNTGKLYGIGVEAMEQVAHNLGLKLEWAEEVGWGSMMEGLESDRYDIVATPVWTQASRARIADFCTPMYYSPVYAYEKAGDKRFKDHDLTILDSPRYTIATIDGATAEQIAKEDFPKARVVSLPQLSDFSQLLLNISTGKADITFTEPADALGFLKNNPGSIEALDPMHPVRVFPNCWLIKRGQYEFKNMIDSALQQLIESGAIEKLIKEYEPQPNALYRVAPNYRR